MNSSNNSAQEAPFSESLSAQRGSIDAQGAHDKERASASGFYLTCRDIGAGTLGGVVQAISVHPLDLIKTRLQSQSAKTVAFEGTWQSMRRTFQYEGILGFYKGVSVPIASAGLCNAVLFSVNGKLRRLVANYSNVDDPKHMTIPQIIVAAEMTAPMYCLVTAPSDLIKSRLQIQSTAETTRYSGMIDCIRTTARVEGFRGIMKGYVPTTLTRFVGLPFYFGGYEYFKRVLESRFVHSDEEKIRLALCNMIAGAIGGVGFFLSATPFDVLKIYMQTREETISLRQAIAQLYAERGIQGFYRGLRLAVFRAAIANGTVFAAVDFWKRQIDRVTGNE